MRDIPKSIFITGTDTGVGKTVVSAALSFLLKKKGKKVGVIKPFQTGTDLDVLTDVEFIFKVLNEDYDLDKVSPCRLKTPLSPYSAAKIENKEIPIKKIIEICEKVISENDITIIEGAGGMYVPVFGNYMIADLILELSCPTILVTRPDLGTINHTMLSIEYAKIKNINMLGIVVNNFPAPPDYTSIDNLATFKTLFNLNILGLIPRLKNIDVENGNIDDICIHPESFFVESLGGSFNYEEFLKNILNPN